MYIFTYINIYIWYILSIYIYIFIYIIDIIPLHSRDYLKKISIQINVATDEGNGRNEIGY